ncbi:serine hydrolase [Mucilaginibacter sp. HMF5004]|uniref:serine hydrolase domain-containing protein n=1 Tax=Mucilaginibacter rivuli TaxID=2857527 RepID=UPI001C5F97E4|nr:serine hydrolase [Mucilaginibacter rivuli]MBW4891181.1 serine hydrolase [Mucilaginibacter rivuli]
MRKTKLNICLWGLLLLFVILNSACAQSPHAQSQAIMNEERLTQSATVLLNNEQQLVPLKDLDIAKIASVHFSYGYASVFDSLLNKYTKVQSFAGIEAKAMNDLSDGLKLYNTVIVTLTETETNNPQIVNFINSNKRLKNVVVVLFGNGKSLAGLDAVNAPIIWCERNTPIAALYTAQVVFGGVPVTQKLGSGMSAKYRAGSGYLTTKTRLQYTIPEDAGINANNLLAIDDIVNSAIRQQATPGCVVLVAKDGKVIYNKAFGYHTYDHNYPDQVNDIFDLASVTKISATTMEVMRLTEQGKLSLDSTVGNYIAKARTTNKSNIKVRELMLHEAGLIPYIPFYEHIKPADFSRDSSDAYPTKVAENYYMRKGYFTDVMWPQMLNSALRVRGKYEYSDLSMYFMREIVETVSAQPLNIYVQKQFYDPLGMQRAGFLPRNRFKKEQIVPTENDTYFRKELLDGYVHDQGAAMAGGVSGHAGLFASANDLGILYQMILNGGTYGGVQYFKPETVNLFTTRESLVSSRGYGFDRTDQDTTKHYPSQLASAQTFGHTGYTGTCFWVDPKYNLVYIFLSNRVYPSDGKKLNQLRVRANVQDAIYRAISKGMQ